jgi:hypothetical protein
VRWTSWIDDLDLRFEVDLDEILDQLGVPRPVRRSAGPAPPSSSGGRSCRTLYLRAARALCPDAPWHAIAAPVGASRATVFRAGPRDAAVRIVARAVGDARLVDLPALAQRPPTRSARASGPQGGRRPVPREATE